LPPIMVKNLQVYSLKLQIPKDVSVSLFEPGGGGHPLLPIWSYFQRSWWVLQLGLHCFLVPNRGSSGINHCKAE
jgi:hypothetical protein